MEYIKEDNKNLINLRTNLITIIIVLTGGIIGLILSQNLNIFGIIMLIIPGLYLDFVFFCNILSINNKIINNIKRLKNVK